MSFASIRAVAHAMSRVVVEAATTIHAGVVLLVVEALVRWVPLPRLSRALGCRVALEPRSEPVFRIRSDELPRRARRQLRCAHRVADSWPLSRGPCLRRTLVAGHLLRRLGTTVRLGTYLDDGEVVAHAWLEIGSRPVEDESVVSMFTAVPTHGTTTSGES